MTDTLARILRQQDRVRALRQDLNAMGELPCPKAYAEKLSELLHAERWLRPFFCLQ